MDPQPPGYATFTPTPSAPYGDAAVSRGARTRRGLIIGLVVVLVCAIAAGAMIAFFVVRGSADALVSDVPAASGAYVTVYLDPSAGQKVNFNNLVSKFPNAGTAEDRDKAINDALDSALKSSGLDHTKVRAWLGSQIAVAVSASSLNALSGGRTASTFSSANSAVDTSAGNQVPELAVLISSKDDSQAATTLAAIKSASSASDWATETTGGVTVNYSASGNIAYAVMNHTAMVATTRIEADLVINTAQGKSANLGDDANYKATIAQLPGDRLGVAYVSVAAVQAALSSNGSSSSSSTTVSALNGYQGAALSLSALSDGVEMDTALTFDPSKLSATQRAALQVGNHPNATVGLMPSNAYAFLALPQVGTILKSLDTTLQSLSPSGKDPLKAFGLDPSGPIVGHLTGDAGIEVGPDSATSGGTGGTLLLATDNDSAMQAYLDGMPKLAGCTTENGDTCPTTTESYKGATITTVADAASLGIQPAWAVYQHTGILGSSSAAVKAAIDAAAGDGVASSSGYKSISGHLVSGNGPVLYIDTQAVATAIRGTMSPANRAHYDQSVAPYLNHVGAVVISGGGGSTYSTARFFVKIS